MRAVVLLCVVGCAPLPSDPPVAPSASVFDLRLDGYRTPGEWGRYGLSDLPGRLALVHSAAYWCSICQDSAREMATAAPRYPAVAFVTLMTSGQLSTGVKPGRDGWAWTGGDCREESPTRADLDEWMYTHGTPHAALIDGRAPAESLLEVQRAGYPEIESRACAWREWFWIFDLRERRLVAEMPRGEQIVEPGITEALAVLDEALRRL